MVLNLGDQNLFKMIIVTGKKKEVKKLTEQFHHKVYLVSVLELLIISHNLPQQVSFPYMLSNYRLLKICPPELRLKVHFGSLENSQQGPFSSCFELSIITFQISQPNPNKSTE